MSLHTLTSPGAVAIVARNRQLVPKAEAHASSRLQVAHR